MTSPIPSNSPRPKVVLPPIEEVKKLTVPEVAATARQLIANVEKVIVGKHEQVVLAVAVWLAEGHLLVEDVPGVAKTMLARAMAQSAGCTFKRIQCTPDLRPEDVLGESRLDPQTGRVEFYFGPLFSQFVLVDEINRASPRTQSALLEAMGESSVTVGKVTYHLQKPFLVIATQNPIEQEGTFQLPEAQKDRFLIQLRLGYPALHDEDQMLDQFQFQHPIENLSTVTTPDHIQSCQEAVRKIQVGREVRDYLLALVRMTREHPSLSLGASPRASLGLFRFAQAMAAIQGKNTVSIELVKSLAMTVLAHRLIVKPDRQTRYHNGSEVIKEILDGRKPE
jgi:MoxR-like ATPase